MLVVGERYFIQNNFRSSKPFLMKVDKNGNYKWHKYLYNTWNNFSLLTHRIYKINENSFILGGIKNEPNNNDGVIIKIDTNGTRIFDVGTIGFSKSSVDDILKLHDGTFLATGENYTFGTYLGKMIYQFNGNTGAKIKSLSLNKAAKSNAASCIAQKPNGIIYVGGATGIADGSTNYNADVLFLNSNLDSLTTILFPMPSNSGLVPRSLLCAKDGGFVLTLLLNLLNTIMN
jgi:hypothetical protein